MSDNQEKLNEQLFNVIADEKASDEARLKKVKYLVRLGADVNTRLYGKSVLSKAIELQDEEVVSFLKNKGAKEWVIPKEEALEVSQGFWDDEGYLKSLEEIKELLKKGADLEAKDKDGITALIEAVSCGMLDVVKCLAEHGADLEAKDKYGNTALMKAAYKGQLDVVKCFVELGADLEAKDKDGRTALMEAAFWGKLDVVKCLVESGADLEAKDKDGRTALDIAKKMKKADCVKFLEEYQKKSLTQKNQDEKTEDEPIKGFWQRMFGGRF